MSAAVSSVAVAAAVNWLLAGTIAALAVAAIGALCIIAYEAGRWSR